jgi:hypothetical protein
MAHFAELDDNNKVLRVIVVRNEDILDENGIEQEQKGIDFCVNLFGGTWIQTSFSGKFRKRLASSGDTYNPTYDAFIQPKHYSSWVFDSETLEYVAPTPMPDNLYMYVWDEETVSWNKVGEILLPPPM